MAAKDLELSADDDLSEDDENSAVDLEDEAFSEVLEEDSQAKEDSIHRAITTAQVGLSSIGEDRKKDLKTLNDAIVKSSVTIESHPAVLVSVHVGVLVLAPYVFPSIQV